MSSSHLSQALAALSAVALLACAVAPVTTPSPALRPPSYVLAHWAGLVRIDSVAALPEAIRRGDFAGPDGQRPRGWKLADPGGQWNATDASSDPSLPFRRLIFAVCDASACVLHYQTGGIALTAQILAFERERSVWKAVYHAYGSAPAASPAALLAVLENRSPLVYHDLGSGADSYY